MKSKSKALQTSKRAVGRPADGAERMRLERIIKAEFDNEPARKIERFEGYKRLLAQGDAAGIHVVINSAFRDKLADQALREHIAGLIDQGREAELSIQLRAYAIKYLVYPIEIMRQRDA